MGQAAECMVGQVSSPLWGQVTTSAVLCPIGACHANPFENPRDQDQVCIIAWAKSYTITKEIDSTIALILKSMRAAIMCNSANQGGHPVSASISLISMWCTQGNNISRD